MTLANTYKVIIFAFPRVTEKNKHVFLFLHYAMCFYYKNVCTH